MNVEIVTTGTELLLGEILNTNFPYLSQQLNKLGLSVLYESTVGDNPGRMEAVLAKAMERADIVITSGGLGPTKGDITKEIVMKLCGVKGYMHEESKRRINERLKRFGHAITENNYKQAVVPEGCEVLTNEVGTAPGVWLEAKGTIFILLPGPPFELKDMVEKQVVPRVKARFAKEGIILSRTLHLRHLGESLVAEELDEIIVNQSNPTIALYARNGEILIRLTAKANSEAEANALIDVMEAQVRAKVGKHIYGVDYESLASCVGRMLRERGETIAFAESCTGGLATSMMTDVAGSSEYVLGSVVSYSHQAKQEIVGVKAETLANYTAISEATAKEMAEGVRKLLRSTYGVGITGNAGPGVSEGKPLGLVYIAVATEKETIVKEFSFGATRTENKQRIAVKAISMVLDVLMSYGG